VTVVLDASALLALAFRERGHEAVAAALPDAVMSAVNFAEVVARLIDVGDTPDRAAASAADFGVPILPFTETQAADAGLLRAATRTLGLSLGDRACLALARELGAPVITADRAWGTLDLGIEVQVLRDG
jgi:PIN domain nuclease of toxin-antitoxin system